MRVMVMVKATYKSETGELPSREQMAEMGRFNDELQKAGLLLEAAGLKPTSKGKRVRFSAADKRTIIDGPFTETKEVVAGFWLWKVKSIEEAMEWARRCPSPMPGEECEIEIRPLYEEEDFAR